jgi:anaerobic magnesium-protoporphyrin IX monomethyl ester cyclase
MRVVFVYIDPMQGKGGKYYEGLASLSAMLEVHGHTTHLLHITDRIDVGSFVSRLNEMQGGVDLLAFSTTTNMFRHAADYANALRREATIFTLFGGIHPTLHPEEVISQPGIDALCRGEGEHPLRELCDKLDAAEDISRIPNLWVKADGETIRNDPRPLSADIDELPPPNRELFEYAGSQDQAMSRLSFMGSRGCPYRCTYCCNEALRALVPNPGSYIRYKSVGRLLDEMKRALEAHPEVEHLTLHDDILTLNRAWFAEFANRYPKEIGLPYICNSRFDIMDEDVCVQMRASGCMQVQLGLESGDEYVRNTKLGRRQDEAQILRVAEMCRRHGLEFFLYTMVGIPGETLGRALNTVKLTARMRPTGVQTTVFYPYPGTRLHDECVANGYLTGEELDSYFEEATVLRLDDFPQDEILFAFRNFERTVSLYERAFALRPPLRQAVERVLDHLWLHPRLYEGARPTFRAVKAVVRAGLGGGA